MKILGMIGTKKGKWIVLDLDLTKKRKSYLCVCECGTEKSVRADHLKTGASIQCKACADKCLKSDYDTQSPTYHSWCSMRYRCDNPNVVNYPDYGGRGVTYCERWKDFKNFLADMGERPEGMTLDKDSIKPGNKVYCKEFCCWATPTTQQRNKRNCKLVPEQVRDIRKLHSEGWSYSQLTEKFGVSRGALTAIVKRLTWKEV